MTAQLCKYTKNHWVVHSGQVNVMVCNFYLNKAKGEKEKEQSCTPFLEAGLGPQPQEPVLWELTSVENQLLIVLIKYKIQFYFSSL